MKKLNLIKKILTLTFAISLSGWFQPAIAKSKDIKSAVLNPLNADSAVKELKEGNKRFLTGQIRHDGQSQQDIERLSTKQMPNSVVLSCSDSRVPPEMIFDQKLGEMFTVRSAGEALSAQSIGSIEFAIEKLGSRLIVILGHTNCGAVKAAIETIHGKSAGSDNLDQLVRDIHPRLKSKFDENKLSKNLKDESWLNAKGVAKDLLSRSALVSKAVESGQVKIQVALYNLETGVVEFE